MSRSLETLSIEERTDLIQEIKHKKNGASDKDWAEIRDAFDLDLSPDTLRKAAVGVMLTEGTNHEAPCAPSEPNEMDGYTERQKLYDLRRDIRKDLREQSRSELLREMIRNAIRDLPALKLPDDFPPYVRPDVARDMTVGIGDFHFGAEYKVCGLYGEVINEYNHEVFERRLVQLLHELERIAEKETPTQMTIMIAGDMLDGLLRASQISRLEYGVVESTIELSEVLSTWIADLSYTLRIPIRVYAVRGNHGEIRPLGSKAGQFPEENMERVVMHYLYARFHDNPYVTIEDGDAPLSRVVDIVGYKFLLIHGQGDDIEKIARDHLTLYNNQIDVFMCGHLHKSQTFTAGMGPGGNVLIERVPSLCGIDPYAQSRGVGSPPGATVILMEEGYGRRCIYPIVLK